jgi:hypothetical protein
MNPQEESRKVGKVRHAIDYNLSQLGSFMFIMVHDIPANQETREKKEEEEEKKKRRREIKHSQ